MTTDMIFAVFEDFNERWEESANPIVALEVPPLENSHEEAWTAGFLAGRREYGPDSDVRSQTAKLVTSVFAMHEQIAASVDAAALAVADLLVVAVAADDWPVRLVDRLRGISDRIKPALTGAPEYLLSDDGGVEHRFADAFGIEQALSSGDSCESISIRWQRGEATISRSALVEDLRRAIVPLSSGPSNQQHARNLP